MNQGHGHVTPRLDGVKARCGGPRLCRVCQQELAECQKRGVALEQERTLSAFHAGGADAR